MCTHRPWTAYSQALTQAPISQPISVHIENQRRCRLVIQIGACVGLLVHIPTLECRPEYEYRAPNAFEGTTEARSAFVPHDGRREASYKPPAEVRQQPGKFEGETAHRSDYVRKEVQRQKG